MHYWILGVIFVIFSLCLSCKRCETRYEPDFTEDELSWVKFEKDTVKYQVKYKEGAKWKVDTITAVHQFSGVRNSSRTEGKCEENIVYKNADDDFNIKFSNGNGFGNLGAYIKKDNGFSVYINSLNTTISEDPRTDTAIIDGIIYQDVYKASTPLRTAVISKSIGLLIFRNSIGEEIKYVP